ncbi:MAG: hypothetical protein CSA68_03100 [Rhodobacterales bacterium]|nr:MAG: hypothetical protein CSA68_03100 [Rhodobacterales bacterium]
MSQPKQPNRLLFTGYMPFLLVVGVTLAYFYFMGEDDGKNRYGMAPVQMELQLVSVVSGNPEVVSVDHLQAEAASGEQLHGCFQTGMSLPMLTETYQLLQTAQPITPTGGLDCFDGAKISAALAADTALAFAGGPALSNDQERVVVVFGDGQGYVWDQPIARDAQSQ